MMVRCLQEAKRRFEIVRLSVFADNTRAKGLYRRMGFQPYGLLPRAIRRGERYIDEEFMYLDLTKWVPPTEGPNR
jgi:ribosomal protein S18 acetylase RimI-like enzyme